VVNQAAAPGTGQFLFTRAGSFNPDQNGNLVNTAGYYLQGWPLTNGTTLPANTSTLSSVETVNVANLAGTATPTSIVNLSLNLPSTAPAAAGGGQINTSISSLLQGITDIDYKTFGTLNDTARIDYVAATSSLTITMGGQTGIFDLSSRLPGIYKSTGTLADMEITVDSAFDFTTDISSITQTNTVSETDRIGAEPSNFALATDLTGITSVSLNASANDNILTFGYDKTTGVLTVTDETAGTSGTVNIGTSGIAGTKDYTIASGGLAGTIVTINTGTFDYGTTFNNTTNANAATKTAGTYAGALTSATTTIDGPALRQLNLTAATDFVFTITQVNAANDTVVLDSGPAGWTVTSPITTGDLSAADATVTFNKGGESFTARIQTAGNLAAGETIQVTLPLTELQNKIAADSDDLVVTTATAPTLSNWDAGDLAALSSTVFNFNVDANGRVLVTSGPTGFTVDQIATQALNTTGNRNVVVTDGTNSFTITLAIGTAITKGSADLTVDLQEAVNTFGLGTAPGGGRFSATVQVFDSLGNAHDLIIDFDKTATNQWEILVNDPVLASSGVKSGNVAPANRSITFNGDGTPSTITFPPIAISGFTTGANDANVTINLGTVNKADGVSQFAGKFALSSIDQNGVRFGDFVGVNINDEGLITAVFDNGEQLSVYQLPLTLFANPNGLEIVTGNAFRQTDRSGDVLLLQAKSGGSGSIASSALESSTVDLAEEFTKMITTQRAYSASAKIITTADEMLEELIRIRR
jgi:flagellar hook-basal body protein